MPSKKPIEIEKEKLILVEGAVKSIKTALRLSFRQK
jgi:hypothetical protein